MGKLGEQVVSVCEEVHNEPVRVIKGVKNLKTMFGERTTTATTKTTTPKQPKLVRSRTSEFKKCLHRGKCVYKDVEKDERKFIRDENGKVALSTVKVVARVCIVEKERETHRPGSSNGGNSSQGIL